MKRSTWIKSAIFLAGTLFGAVACTSSESPVEYQPIPDSCAIAIDLVLSSGEDLTKISKSAGQIKDLMDEGAIRVATNDMQKFNSIIEKLNASKDTLDSGTVGFGRTASSLDRQIASCDKKLNAS